MYRSGSYIAATEWYGVVTGSDGGTSDGGRRSSRCRTPTAGTGSICSATPWRHEAHTVCWCRVAPPSGLWHRGTPVPSTSTRCSMTRQYPLDWPVRALVPAGRRPPGAPGGGLPHALDRVQRKTIGDLATQRGAGDPATRKTAREDAHDFKGGVASRCQIHNLSCGSPRSKRSTHILTTHRRQPRAVYGYRAVVGRCVR